MYCIKTWVDCKWAVGVFTAIWNVFESLFYWIFSKRHVQSKVGICKTKITCFRIDKKRYLRSDAQNLLLIKLGPRYEGTTAFDNHRLWAVFYIIVTVLLSLRFIFYHWIKNIPFLVIRVENRLFIAIKSEEIKSLKYRKCEPMMT